MVSRTTASGVLLLCGLLAGCGATTQAPPPSASAGPISAAPATAAGAASAATSTKPAASGAAAGGIRAAYVGPFDNMAVMWVAKEKDLWAKHGLNVDLQAVNGSPIGTAAVLSHDVDIVEMSAPPIIAADVKGADLEMIAGFDNVFIFTLMVEPSIKSLQDLKGKTAVVAQIGAENDTVLRKVLLQNGLQPDTDVHIVAARDPAGQLSLIKSKQAQAVMGSGSNLAEYKQAGFVPLLDIGELHIPFQSAGLVSARSYVSAHRPQVLDFLKASADAIHFLKTDEAGTKAIMAKYLTNDNPDVLDGAWHGNADFMDNVPLPTLPGIQEIMNEQHVTGHRPEDFADLSLVQDLEKRGYFNSIGASASSR